MAKFDWMEQVLTAVKAINNQGRGATLPEIIRFIKDRLDGLLVDRNNVSGVVRSALWRGVARGMLSRGERGRYNMLTRSTGGSRHGRRRRLPPRQNRRRRGARNAPKRRRRRAAAVEKETPLNADNVPEEKGLRVTRRRSAKAQPKQPEKEQQPVETRSEHCMTPPPPDVPLPTPDNEVRPGADDEDADDVNRQPYAFRDPQEADGQHADSLDEDVQNIYK